MEILRFARRERDTIVRKIDEQKSKQLLAQDRALLLRLLDSFERDFDLAWNERKSVISEHAKFCLFAGSLRKLSLDLDDLTSTVRMRTEVTDSLTSVTSAEAFARELPKTMANFEDRIRTCDGSNKCRPYR